MQDSNKQVLDKLEKMEKNIANLGSKNITQDGNIGQINRSVYETKEKVDLLSKEVSGVKEGVKVLKEDLDECNKRIENTITKGFSNINNGGFYPDSIKLIIEQNEQTNKRLEDMQKLNIERDKIELEIKKTQELTKRSRFSFLKAIIVAGITVLGVKILEWIQTLIG